jgi:hypothetical protein
MEEFTKRPLFLLTLRKMLIRYSLTPISNPHVKFFMEIFLKSKEKLPLKATERVSLCVL